MEHIRGKHRKKGKKMFFYSDDDDPSPLLKSITKLLKRRGVPMKYLNTLQLELQFLRTFCKRCFEYHSFLTEKENERYHNVKDLLMRATGVDETENERYHKFINMATYVVDEVELMSSQIREVHRITRRPSPSHDGMRCELVIRIIDSLLENLKDLISIKVDLVDPLKIKLQALEEKLRFEHHELKDLLMHAKAVDDILRRDPGFYLNDFVEMGTSKRPDGKMIVKNFIDKAAYVVNEVKLMRSEIREVHKIMWRTSPSCNRMIYELVIKFIDSLLENLKDKAAYMPDEVKLMRSEIREVHKIIWGTFQPHNRMDSKLVIGIIDSHLENLNDLISFKVDLVDPLKIELEALEEKLRFYYHNVKDLLMLAKAVDDLLMRATAMDSRAKFLLKNLEAMKKPYGEMTATKFIAMATSVEDDVKLMKSDIREVHKVIWGTSRSHNHMGYELVIKIIDSLLDVISKYPLQSLFHLPKNKVDPLKIKLEALEEKLRFEYHNLKDLLMHAKAVDDLLMRATAVDERAVFDLKDLVEMSRSKRHDEKMMAIKFINMAAYVVDEVKLIRSEVREVHKLMWRTSPSQNRLGNELVIKFINSLLENLKDLISFKVDLVDPLEIKLKALGEKLRFLGTFLMFARRRCQNDEELKDLFTYAKVVADNAAYLSYSCLVVDEMDEHTLHTLVSDLSNLVQKIGPVTPEVRQIYISILKGSSDNTVCTGDEISVDFVESLLENTKELLSASWTIPMRDEIEILQAELVILRSFLLDLPNEYFPAYKICHLKESDLISRKAGSVVYSLYDNEMNEETATNVYFSLFEFLEETKFLKAQIKEMYYEDLKSPCPKFPSTDELGFLDCFFENLRELRNNRTDSITCLNLPVEPLVEELQFLRSFLGRIGKQPTEVEKLKVFWTQVIDVAYRTEYIIDSLLVRNGPIWHRMLWLSEVRKEIEVLTAEANKIGEMKMHGSEVHHDAEISGQVSSQATSSEMDEVVVGFEDEEGSIIEYLVSGSRKLQMISIVGMPGLGKTHLAKKIYNNSNLKDHFHVRVWCYVSQVYNRKYLLTRILNQVMEPPRNMLLMTDEELADALHKSLKGKR